MMRMKYCSGSAANRSGVGPVMPRILSRYVGTCPAGMEDAEWRAFVSEGTRTGKLADPRHDGRPHVVPIWFVLDGDDFVFTTGENTVKGRSLRRHRPRAPVRRRRARRPTRSSRRAAPSTSRATRRAAALGDEIGGRYMGADRAEEFGRRNAAMDELLVRLHADHVFAQADIAGYE